MKNKKPIDAKFLDFDDVFDDGNQKNKNMFKVLIGIIKTFWPKYLLSIFVYIVKASPVWIVPVLTSKIIDIISKSEVDGNPIKTVLILGAIIFALYLQNVPTHYWYSLLTNKTLCKCGGALKSAVVRKLQRLSLTYYKEIESGKLQSKFLKDVDAVNSLVARVTMSLTQVTIGLIVSIGISLYNSPLMTLFFMAVVPANVILAKFFRKNIAKKYRTWRLMNEKVSSLFSSMLKMMPIMKAHGLENKEIGDFNQDVKKLTQAEVDADMASAFFGAWVWVVSGVLSASCLILCSILALLGKMSIGNVVLYQTLFTQINSNVSSIVNMFPDLVSGFESLTSVSEIMNSEDIEHEGEFHLKNIKGKFDFENVSYSYPRNPDKDVIKNFTLHVSPGECIAFVGSSGSGKTTIVNMIIGYLKPKSGVLKIDDKDVNDIRLHNYRHHISVVPQNGILFPGTIRENITYGLEQYSEEELNKAVEMANINEFLPELPDGLNSWVGEEGDMLSGGQKQRITIARALIRNPAILILDEATSALDNVSEYHVQQAIEKGKVGRTTFIVAHRLSTIRNADRIVVMETGRIIECGTYSELMEKKGKFFELKSLSDMATKNIQDENYSNQMI